MTNEERFDTSGSWMWLPAFGAVAAGGGYLYSKAIRNISVAQAAEKKIASSLQEIANRNTILFKTGSMRAGSSIDYMPGFGLVDSALRDIPSEGIVSSPLTLKVGSFEAVKKAAPREGGQTTASAIRLIENRKRLWQSMEDMNPLNLKGKTPKLAFIDVETMYARGLKENLGITEFGAKLFGKQRTFERAMPVMHMLGQSTVGMGASFLSPAIEQAVGSTGVGFRYPGALSKGAIKGVHSEINRLLKAGYTLAGHNIIKADMPWLNTAFEKYGLPKISTDKMIDTLELSRMLKPTPAQGVSPHALPNLYGRMLEQGSIEAIEGAAHTVKFDVAANISVFKSLRKDFEKLSTAWSKEQWKESSTFFAPQAARFFERYSEYGPFGYDLNRRVWYKFNKFVEAATGTKVEMTNLLTGEASTTLAAWESKDAAKDALRTMLKPSRYYFGEDVTAEALESKGILNYHRRWAAMDKAHSHIEKIQGRGVFPEEAAKWLRTTAVKYGGNIESQEADILTRYGKDVYGYLQREQELGVHKGVQKIRSVGFASTAESTVLRKFFDVLEGEAPSFKDEMMQILEHEQSGGIAETVMHRPVPRAAIEESRIMQIASEQIAAGQSKAYQATSIQGALARYNIQKLGYSTRVPSAMAAIEKSFTGKGLAVATIVDNEAQVVRFMMSKSKEALDVALARLEQTGELTAAHFAVPFEREGIIKTGEEGVERAASWFGYLKKNLEGRAAFSFKGKPSPFNPKDWFISPVYGGENLGNIVTRGGEEVRVLSGTEWIASHVMARSNMIARNVDDAAEVARIAQSAVNEAAQSFPQITGTKADLLQQSRINISGLIDVEDLKATYPTVTSGGGLHQIGVQQVYSKFGHGVKEGQMLYAYHGGGGTVKDIALLQDPRKLIPYGEYWQPERPIQYFREKPLTGPGIEDWRKIEGRHAVLGKTAYVTEEGAWGGGVRISESYANKLGGFKKIGGEYEPIATGTKMLIGTEKGTIHSILPDVEMEKMYGQGVEVAMPSELVKHESRQSLLESIHHTVQRDIAEGGTRFQHLADKKAGDIPAEDLIKIYEKELGGTNVLYSPVSFTEDIPYATPGVARTPHLQSMRAQGLSDMANRIMEAKSARFETALKENTPLAQWLRDVKVMESMIGSHAIPESNLETITLDSLKQMKKFDIGGGDIPSLRVPVSPSEFEAIAMRSEEPLIRKEFTRMELALPQKFGSREVTSVIAPPTVMSQFKVGEEIKHKMAKSAVSFMELANINRQVAEAIPTGVSGELMSEYEKAFTRYTGAVTESVQEGLESELKMQIPDARWGQTQLLQTEAGKVSRELGTIEVTPHKMAKMMGVSEAKIAAGQVEYGMTIREPQASIFPGEPTVPSAVQYRANPDIYFKDVRVKKDYQKLIDMLGKPAMEAEILDAGEAGQAMDAIANRMNRNVLRQDQLEKLLAKSKIAEGMRPSLSEVSNIAEQILNKTRNARESMHVSMDVLYALNRGDVDADHMIGAIASQASQEERTQFQRRWLEMYGEKGKFKTDLNMTVQKELDRFTAAGNKDFAKMLGGLQEATAAGRYEEVFGFLSKVQSFGVGPVDIMRQQMEDIAHMMPDTVQQKLSHYTETLKQKLIVSMKRADANAALGALREAPAWLNALENINAGRAGEATSAIRNLGVPAADLSDEAISLLSEWAPQGQRISKMGALESTLKGGHGTGATAQTISTMFGGKVPELKQPAMNVLKDMYGKIPKGVKWGALGALGLWAGIAAIRPRDRFRPIESMPQSDRAPMSSGGFMPPVENKQNIVRADFQEPYQDFENMFVNVTADDNTGVSSDKVSSSVQGAFGDSNRGVHTSVSVNDNTRGIRDVVATSIRDLLSRRAI